MTENSGTQALRFQIIAGGFRGHTLPDNDSRTEIKVLLHNVKQLSLTLVGGPIVEDRNGEGMGNSNGIGHLIQHM